MKKRSTFAVISGIVGIVLGATLLFGGIGLSVVAATDMGGAWTKTRNIVITDNTPEEIVDESTEEAEVVDAVSDESEVTTDEPAEEPAEPIDEPTEPDPVEPTEPVEPSEPTEPNEEEKQDVTVGSFLDDTFNNFFTGKKALILGIPFVVFGGVFLAIGLASLKKKAMKRLAGFAIFELIVGCGVASILFFKFSWILTGCLIGYAIAFPIFKLLAITTAKNRRNPTVTAHQTSSRLQKPGTVGNNIRNSAGNIKNTATSTASDTVDAVKTVIPPRSSFRPSNARPEQPHGEQPRGRSGRSDKKRK
jgi:hypothetical protein